jgi:hypothetical protein
VPEGFTAVVRQVTSYQDIGPYDLGVFFRVSLGADSIQFVALQAVSAASTAEWQGRVVVPGGGQIFILYSALGSTPQFYVGGYLLRNTLP